MVARAAAKSAAVGWAADAIAAAAEELPAPNAAFEADG
ncbi:hypothetical protein LG3211_3792 [Lysobacter gummosus]|nr:hypothetical protein LG3211_3792 [Lysobacter gummosus]